MKIEFDGTNYQTESNPQTQDSKFDFGFVYPVTSLMLAISIKEINKFWNIFWMLGQKIT